MTLIARIRALAQGLCPETCPRCGDESEAGFCSACSADFVRVADPCPACGLPGRAHACPADAPDWRLDGIRAPFVYAAPLAQYFQRLKFARQHRLGRALGLLFAREFDGSAIAGSELLVAVPLHARRLRERTFNQADEIARPIARALCLTQKSGGIRRRVHTGAQTGLSRSERLGNLERAFHVRGRLDGVRIAIVDDVITTGATVNALAAAMKEAGAVRVEAWAVARTVGPAADSAQVERKM